MMLPGDFIAMKLTGDITTTSSALSEGVFWDFKKEKFQKMYMQYYGFDENCIPDIRPVFSEHGFLCRRLRAELSLERKYSGFLQSRGSIEQCAFIKCFETWRSGGHSRNLRCYICGN